MDYPLLIINVVIGRYMMSRREIIPEGTTNNFSYLVKHRNNTIPRTRVSKGGGSFEIT